MASNIGFVVVVALASTGVTALFAIGTQGPRLPLLAIAFAFGGLVAVVALLKYRSPAAIWTQLRRPPQ